MLLPLDALFYFMPVKNVYITTDKEFNVVVEKWNDSIRLIIQDDITDASSKSTELIFDKPTIKQLAEEILKEFTVITKEDGTVEYQYSVTFPLNRKKKSKF